MIGGVILALAIVGLFFLPDPWRVVSSLVAAFIEVGEVFLWIKFLRRYRVKTGAEGMVGERAEAIGRSTRPAGSACAARSGTRAEPAPVADGAPGPDRGRSTGSRWSSSPSRRITQLQHRRWRAAVGSRVHGSRWAGS